VEWDTGKAEPDGWIRHVPSWRRRIYIWEGERRVGKFEWVAG